jgi:hypothetical protein
MILFGFKSVQSILFSFPPDLFFLLPMADLVVVATEMTSAAEEGDRGSVAS